MKLYNPGLPGNSAMSYAGLIEKIEILRTTLRWANRLERADIEKLLRQSNVLRDEVMQLSHKERFIKAASESNESDEGPARERLPGERRQALLARSFVFEGTFGDNPELLDALEVAEKAAPTDLPVLIDGESGTGKELMAKVIHANGSRSDKPFISVNCGAIPENLIESELFGHKRGSFTGAATDRKGKFESAHKGTIFLDEIGELPLTGQVKLLRVLEAHEIQRVGSDEPIPVDTRIVAATNRNLRKLSEEGIFREDLFYRLSVIHVNLPPLRQRKDEIPLLFSYFCDEAAEMMKRRPIRMTPQLREFLLNYRYPGNIRELRNLIYRLSCLAGETADVVHLPVDIRPGASVDAARAASAVTAATATTATSPASVVPAAPASLHGLTPPAASGARHIDVSGMPLLPGALSDARRIASDEAEKAFLEKGLREVGGTVSELARRCEMNRSHLQMLLKKHGIHSKDFRAPRKAAADEVEYGR
ncbi:sigma-54 dependent transcriptional regulator [Noviherbaspirillum sp. CPCC 100848]|uniref:Sigma-54 dependent transcriptional regulator n=1 Tax=Noviherbaspirillum album TaxID=3080276 RepID=A0ABU6JFV1_9BURK|nr:sigma-54 dependent transcriptional regulator [Noviherbaspirillum sp. CPCC 100848]MEC4722542.1 sigma-54 dependent transcriptional regulator [Noviherbaspirillum sp. CPCC 100848]